MVLSNKKLKQKLRAAVAESIANSESGSGPIQQKAPSSDSNPQSQSLKELLVSASQKPRLSKQEKRRKIRSSEVGGNGNGKEEAGIRENGEKSSAEGVDDGDKKGKRKKKRKRVQETEQNAGGGGGGDGDGDGEVKVGKKKKKSNNKKKNKERWGKKGDKKEKIEGQPQNEEENNIVADSQVTGEDARKVYVGGIPYYSTEDDIRSYFESCGTITEVDCMQFPESGKFRGIAIISFKTEEAAKRALALDGSDMGGLFLKILPYKGTTRTNKPSNFVPPVVEGYNRIYIGNLSWDRTEDDLRKFLSGCNILSIRFGMDKETGEFRGYAHVDFSDSLSMNMAIKLDQEILCGRPVKVTSAIPKKNAKFQPHETSISAATTAVAADATATAAATATVTATVASTNDAVSNGGTNISSGKMRRRTCYICSEKGHISSACPKKPVDDSTNSTAT